MAKNTIKVNSLKLNKDNPRIKNDAKYQKLKNSLKSFIKMLSLRPIIVDENNTVLGGNMRLRALIDLGYEEIPKEWVKKASELTKEEKQEFIIKDNLNYGDWDFEKLEDDFDLEQLNEWGLKISEDNFEPKEPGFNENSEEKGSGSFTFIKSQKELLKREFEKISAKYEGFNFYGL